MKHQNLKKIILAVLIILFGVIFRIFLNERIGIPNFEAVTSLSLLSGSLFGGIYTGIIPLLIIFLSDSYFGNTSILFFTWSAFILIGIFGIIIKKNSKYYLLKMTGMGILSVLFFYLWTNFGWWLLSGMYPKTFLGILQSYIAALPFLKNQLISVSIFIPSFIFISSLILNYYKKYKIRLKLKAPIITINK